MLISMYHGQQKDDKVIPSKKGNKVILQKGKRTKVRGSRTSTTGLATTSYTLFCEENSVSTSSNSNVSDSQLFLRSFSLFSFKSKYYPVRP